MEHPGNENTYNGPVGVLGFADSVNDILGNEPTVAPAEGEKFVTFHLNDKVFAVPAGDIVEVILPLPVTSLPGSPAWFLGLANFRGELLGIISLKAMWNNEGPASSDKAKLIVLRAQDASTQFALKVDKLSEIVTIPSSEIQPASTETLQHISGIAPRGSGTLHLIDSTRLLKSLAFD